MLAALGAAAPAHLGREDVVQAYNTSRKDEDKGKISGSGASGPVFRGRSNPPLISGCRPLTRISPTQHHPPRGANNRYRPGSPHHIRFTTQSHAYLSQDWLLFSHTSSINRFIFAGYFEGGCLVIRDKEDLLPCNFHFEIRLFLPMTISGLFQRS